MNTASCAICNYCKLDVHHRIESDTICSQMMFGLTHERSLAFLRRQNKQASRARFLTLPLTVLSCPSKRIMKIATVHLLGTAAYSNVLHIRAVLIIGHNAGEYTVACRTRRASRYHSRQCDVFAGLSYGFANELEGL